jgi:PTH1 family peptidyl-tRNA hydrolase
MKLIVGLGNPGEKYERTRHNVGFRVLDALGLNFSHEKKFNADVAKDGDVLYCKPLTFMNNSGQAVRALVDYYKIDPADVTVVYDDKDLQFGTIRLRSVGSAGGHNGVRSIIGNLGTNEFGRVRVGVAAKSPIDNTADFVLARFTPDEEDRLPQIIDASVTILREIQNGGPLTHRDVLALE